MRLNSKTTEWAILVLLLSIVLGSMALDGVPQAGIAFIAALLLPFGFGKLLWSKDPSREWLAISAIAITIVFAMFSGFTTALLYGGLMIAAQLVAKLLVLASRKGNGEAESKVKP